MASPGKGRNGSSNKTAIPGPKYNPSNATDTSNAWWRELEDGVNSVQRAFWGRDARGFVPAGSWEHDGWFPLLKCPTTISTQPGRAHNVLQMGTQWLRGVKEVARGHRAIENGWAVIETMFFLPHHATLLRNCKAQTQNCLLLSKPLILVTTTPAYQPIR